MIYQKSLLPKPRRSAFSLIELLVVMAIITALAALTAGAVMRYLTTQKQNNTETTIAKIDSELKKAWQKVIDDALKDPNMPGAWIDSVYGTNGDVRLQRAIYVKLKLMQQFPICFSEVLNYDSVHMLPPEPAYVKYLSQYSPVLNPQPALYESSACLLMALQRNRGRMDLSPDYVGATSIMSTASGLPYFADGWSNPVTFYRWPTASDEINLLDKATSGPATVKRDSQDPDGKLMDPTWWASTGRSTFDQYIHQLSDPSLAIDPTPKSRYLVPVIVSWGPNQKLGFDVWNAGTPNPMSVGFSGAAIPGNVQDTNDNIYNFRLSLGGKGN